MDKICIMPFLSEFGWFIMRHIRVVHSIKAEHKVVSCRKGQEVYFPTANEFFYDWQNPIPPANRICSSFHLQESRECDEIRSKLKSLYPEHKILQGKDLSFGIKDHKLSDDFFRHKFALKPKRIGLEVDVVIAPRKKRLVDVNRNWGEENWEYIVQSLIDNDLSFAISGTKDETMDFPQAKFRSWEFSTADAEIEMLQNCKLYVGLNSGVSHLASFVDANSLVINSAKNYREFLRRMKITTSNPKNFIVTEETDPQILTPFIIESVKTLKILNGGISLEEIRLPFSTMKNGDS